MIGEPVATVHWPEDGELRIDIIGEGTKPMGDRANIVFYTCYEDYQSQKKVRVGPLIYTHWGSDAIDKDIAAVRTLMQGRLNDPTYTSARMVAQLCSHTPNNKNGVGVSSLTDYFEELLLSHLNAEQSDLLADSFSPGDGGLILVDCGNAHFPSVALGGYWADPKNHLRLNMRNGE